MNNAALPQDRKTLSGLDWRTADMGLSRLRSFVCLAEELHFGRAARLLHISQPALSQQIARLEKDLATILLLRTSRVVRLTPAGHEFLRGARSALAILDDAAYAAHFRAALASQSC
ncbi:LysR family transcriptional regulator [Streptomyces sp. NBC_01477]|uniref:LysR family transcriptional regulator n=1 Tax=Streptomyces sp. NBC_01477 TaxID=2976015 RepID=UPI002E328B34|nr:LysR family transcriptional regulator [Streptomyces sp. NBC_01477]